MTNRNHDLEAAIQRAMTGRPSTSIPLVTDAAGKAIGIPAVVIALNRPVLQTLEEIIRKIVREELQRAVEEKGDVEVSSQG